MDESKKSPVPCDVENSQMIEQLSNGIEKILFHHMDSNNGSSLSHFNSKTRMDYPNAHSEFGHQQFSADSIGDGVANVSLDCAEKMENKNSMMLSIDVPSTSISQEHAKFSKRDSQYKTEQNIDVQPTKNNLQLMLGYFDGKDSKCQTRGYQSYSNLIKMCCTKCKLVSRTGIDYKCYKCQSSLLFQCIKCNGFYKKHIAILNHIKYECYKLPTFFCSICIYTTCQKSNLIKHIHKNHSTLDESEYSYQCSVCKKKFKKQQYMLKHEKICDREVSLVCQYCPYKTKSNQVLVQHIQKKHQQSTIDYQKRSRPNKKNPKRLQKLFKCDHCHFKTTKKFAIIDHIKNKHALVL